MTTPDPLHQWSAADEVYAAADAGITTKILCRKFRMTPATVKRFTNHGEARHRRRTGVIVRERLIKHQLVNLPLDPEWRLPCDVLLTTPSAILTAQQGCELGTLLTALRGRE
jgi:hypothetical protein